MKTLLNLTVTITLAVALGATTGVYVANFITPALAYWLLYFWLSSELIKRYNAYNSKDKNA